MRLAILADIHGNLPAFEAALAHARAQAPDQIVIAGDIVNGSPDSAACWRLARSLGVPMLQGNHERYVYNYGTPHAQPSLDPEQFAPVRWSHDQLSAAERAELAALPGHLRLAEAPDLLIVHASQRSDRESIHNFVTDAQLAEMFPAPDASLIVRGHNHAGAVRPWGERLLVTAGAVGLPLNNVTTAQYLILDRAQGRWRITHHSVPYDLEAALQRFHSTGYLAAAGVMGRLLYRELATASFYMVPFLEAYSRWREVAPLSLEQALERFLSL
ncbi:metallophosphoesterase [Oscillochloris sp. ZM17-4]|uniref:metallophosphoesterase family protein n=1 Tax=Oscillochloris sp. ZM17-4 TaxID=2866714 RepID=UPI001C7349F6|nr:metallophosphoesterase family protein [Oscillochloris sp. ZM17-4]MBX0329848.1 metallophosphoesterase [Oscillochloris sp. ZM17-4]